MTNYDSFKHRRRSIRLPDWDYRSPGYYFVTMCTYQRECLFDEVAYIDIAANALQRVPEQKHAQHVALANREAEIVNLVKKNWLKPRKKQNSWD